MKVVESLQGINAYPVPGQALLTITAKRGLDPQAEATQAVLTGSAFNLARADVLWWLSMAPNVSQGGQSYSFTEEDRRRMRREAEALWDELGDDGGMKAQYGYKGDTL
jgi:hypothetical protein